MATVFGLEISRSEVVAAGDEPAQLLRFRDLVWERVAGHYVAEYVLAATAAEVDEFMSYHSEFERRDRAQRARKLEELNQRLTQGELAPEERSRLEEFRAVLRRLAQHDAEKDRSEPPDPKRLAALSKPYVEMWKMNKALHEQYRRRRCAHDGGPRAPRRPVGAHPGLRAPRPRAVFRSTPARGSVCAADEAPFRPGAAGAG